MLNANGKGIDATIVNRVQDCILVPAYCVPERLIDGVTDSPYGTEFDMWSFGAILFEMCAKEKFVDWKFEEVFDVKKAATKGATPLFLAAQAASVGCVRALLDAGSDVHATDKLGHQVAHWLVPAELACSGRMPEHGRMPGLCKVAGLVASRGADMAARCQQG